MIKNPIDIAESFPVRRWGKQKKAFREEITRYCTDLGYVCTEEKTGLRGKNLIIGNPETARHLVTAHYDTGAGMLLPNFVTPCNFWIYLLYQIGLTLVLMLPAITAAVVAFLITKNLDLLTVFFLAGLMVTVLLKLYGPANSQNANDNTSGVVTVLEIAAALPEKYREYVCFVLFDLEEAGLIGSSSYRSAHKKQTNRQIIWNFHCVGEGDDIVFFPSRRIKKDPDVMSLLEKCHQTAEEKRVWVHKKFHFYPSDQSNFPGGIGIAALKKGKVGLYLDKLHSHKDTVLETENVNILRRTMLSVIVPDEVE